MTSSKSDFLCTLLLRVYFSRCPTNGELAHRLMKMVVVVMMMAMMMMMTIMMMINDGHDHNHQDNDFDDDDDTEMMIRALRVSWVNCGKGRWTVIQHGTARL